MDYKPNISAFTIIVSFFCLALVGLALVPLLPVRLSPSRELPQLSVSFQMYGNSARTIEMEATSKLESMLSRIGGIRRMTSTSGNGYGEITMELDHHADIDVIRFEASSIIRQTWPSLPENMSYPIIAASRPDEKEDRPFLSYTLNAPASPIFIQRYAEERVKPRLSGIPGIYRIDVEGATPMEWQLVYDTHQLEQLEIDLDQVIEAIGHYYKEEFLGIVNVSRGQSANEWIRLALMPDRDHPGFESSRIAVTNKKGKLIRLDQILRVSHREEEPTSYFRINGLNSVYLSIRAEKTANQLSLAKQVKEAMADLRESLPAGYEMHVSYDATEYIQKELDTIYLRTGFTILILLLFVWGITRESRYLFLIVISLTVNLCVAVIFYYLLRLEIQLYSLAGITISLSLVIDNTIVMTDHIRNRHDRKAFLSILAATLTTIGALVIIFFLDEKIRLNLQDFAAVIIINLAVSLAIALFLVPALIERFRLEERKGQAGQLPRFWRRFPVWFSRYYGRQISFMCRWRKTICCLLLLAFGVPVFLLPEKIEYPDPKEKRVLTANDTLLIEKYNELVSKPIWKETIKPIVDKALGGTLRLFVEKVYEGSYFTRDEETVLSISASLPSGTTLEQTNHLVGRMEAYLSGFKEIRQFQTSIYNPQQALINVYFTREAERSGFPYVLKSQVVSKALELGGGSWSVFGLMDQGFSNDVREYAGSYRIEMLGYNYDELLVWAERLKEQLLTYRRIKEVQVNARFSWWKSDYQEFVFRVEPEGLARASVDPLRLFASTSTLMGRDNPAGSIVVDGESENLRLTSRQADEYDTWSLVNLPIQVGTRSVKLAEIGKMTKEQIPQEVVKEDQQYRLCLQYEYVGSGNQGRRIQERVLNEFNRLLPMGYTARPDDTAFYWGGEDSGQYWLLALIIVIIFFTTSILFNSLWQPLSVIFVIPVSYIGVFLTFYLFHLNFDQGGFASFVLLCGITVNASIYILNEYNRLRERKPLMSPLTAYLKAWNAKIVPIFLTVVSTILGFVPFLIGVDKEAFWFPLAAGTIGGLALSVVGIFFFLPVFSRIGNH